MVSSEAGSCCRSINASRAASCSGLRLKTRIIFCKAVCGSTAPRSYSGRASGWVFPRSVTSLLSSICPTMRAGVEGASPRSCAAARAACSSFAVSAPRAARKPQLPRTKHAHSHIVVLDFIFSNSFGTALATGDSNGSVRVDTLSLPSGPRNRSLIEVEPGP